MNFLRDKNFHQTWLGPMVVGLLLAVLGFWYQSYQSDIKEKKEKAQNELQAIESEINQFWHPLALLLDRSKKQWIVFRERHGNDRPSYWGMGKVSDEEAKKWVTYMKSTFFPIHRKMEELINKKMPALDENDASIKEAIDELLLHIDGYKSVSLEWDQGIYERNTSINNFPSNIDQLVMQKISRMKAKAEELKKQN